MFFLYLLSWSRSAAIVCKTVVCDMSWSLLFYHRSGMVLLVTRCGVGGEEVLVFVGERFLPGLRKDFERRRGKSPIMSQHKG